MQNLSAIVFAAAFAAAPATRPATVTTRPVDRYVLDFDTPVNADLQAAIERIDTRLRGRFGMTTAQTAVGALDLRHLRLAMIHPDRIEYAASVAKIGILLAYFQIHPEAATRLDPKTRHELGLMAKASSDEMAAKTCRDIEGERQQSELHFAALKRLLDRDEPGWSQ